MKQSSLESTSPQKLAGLQGQNRRRWYRRWYPLEKTVCSQCSMHGYTKETFWELHPELDTHLPKKTYKPYRGSRSWSRAQGGQPGGTPRSNRTPTDTVGRIWQVVEIPKIENPKVEIPKDDFPPIKGIIGFWYIIHITSSRDVFTTYKVLPAGEMQRCTATGENINALG